MREYPANALVECDRTKENGRSPTVQRGVIAPGSLTHRTGHKDINNIASIHGTPIENPHGRREHRVAVLFALVKLRVAGYAG